MSICLPSTKNRTDVILFVEPAATRSPAVLPTHAFSAGVTHVSAGPETPVMRTGWNAVFGWMSLPTELTFFGTVIFRALDEDHHGGCARMMVFGRSARKQVCGEVINFEKRGHQSRETRARSSGGKDKNPHPMNQLQFFTAL
jgi:hypothetical protein